MKERISARWTMRLSCWGSPWRPSSFWVLWVPQWGIMLVKPCTRHGRIASLLNEHFRQLVEAKIPAIYQGMGPGKQVLPKVAEIWKDKGDKEFVKEEILDRLLTNLTLEIDLILKEKVVPDPKDIDTAMIMGAGWPFFNGGITLYLDVTGYTPKVLQKVFFRL